ncbi:MAG TPA: TIGR02281 family clan AA aspartic protease [Allosphingosinicella sp.]
MSGNGDDALSFLYALAMLALIGSAFAARRAPIGQSAKMAIAWIAIFGVVFVGFSLRDDFKALGRRILQGAGSGTVVAEGGEVRIRKGENGHFSVDAKINGKDVEFLVDSGATITTVSGETAEDVGLEPQGLAPVIVETANGMARSWRSRAKTLNVGGIERGDFAVHIGGEGTGTNLLGMNFLSTLSSWRVEGDWLILQP